MTRFARWAAAALLIASTVPPRAVPGEPSADVSAGRRALAYLAREVPRWRRENHCYSCHNNGDAARALYDALGRSEPVPPAALDETTAWLSRPEAWDRNGGDGPFSDKRLARVQFASALAAATRVGAVKDRGPLRRAARRLARDQDADGSWPVEDGGGVGSPAAYGRPLATWMARQALRDADEPGHRAAIERADRWLLGRPVATTPDAAVALLATAGRRDASSQALRGRALDRLRLSQSGDGGFGPYRHAPPEPFDTALAMLALAALDPTPETRAMTARGRAYLVAAQAPDGSWPETTRPAGAESYAQRVSTTGWAALALRATGERER